MHYTVTHISGFLLSCFRKNTNLLSDTLGVALNLKGKAYPQNVRNHSFQINMEKYFALELDEDKILPLDLKIENFRCTSDGVTLW